MPTRSAGDEFASHDDMQPNHSRPLRGHRHGATFVPDWRAHCRPLDRNARARIMYLAERLEVRTKKPGRRNGIVSLVGLAVLRALLFQFLNAKTGLCYPSYGAIQKRTGLCRQSVAVALARLELCGVLKIVRRLVRARVDRVSPVTGLPESYTGTVQTTSLYAMREPAAYAEHLRLPTGRKAPFPSPRQLQLLDRMQLFWTTKLSLAGRKEQPPRVSGLIASALRSPQDDAEPA